MEIQDSKYTILNNLSGILLGAYCFIAIISYSSFKVSYPDYYVIFDVSRILILFLMGIVSIMKIKYLTKFLEFAILLGLGITLMLITKNNNVFFIILILLVYNVKNLTPLVIINIIKKNIFGTTILLIILSLSNIIQNIEVFRIMNNGLLQSRLALGFTHPNSFGFMVVMYIVLTFWSEWIIKAKFLTFKSLSIIMFGIYPIVVIADSRTPFFLVILITSLCFFIDIKTVKIKNLYKISLLTLIVSIFMTVYFSIFYQYSNSLHLFLSRMLSGRLDLLNTFYERYGFSILGQYVYMTSSTTKSFLEDYSYLDSGFGRAFIEFGFLFATIFIILFVISIITSKKCNNYGALVFSIFISIYLVIQDRFMVEPVWSLPLFIFAFYKKADLLFRSNVKRGGYDEESIS
jgi:hypothetical protein